MDGAEYTFEEFCEKVWYSIWGHDILYSAIVLSTKK